MNQFQGIGLLELMMALTGSSILLSTGFLAPGGHVLRATSGSLSDLETTADG